MASNPKPPSPPIETHVAPRRPGVTGRSARAFWQMSVWKKLLLVLSIAIFAVGVTGSVIGATRPEPPVHAQAQATIESLQVPSGSSLTPQQQQTLDDAKTKVSETAHWFYDKTAPHLWRIGLSFFVAFVLGFMARSFVKTAAMMLAVVLAIAVVGAYFGPLDLGKFRENLTQSAGKAMDQMQGLKDLVITFFGASLSGTIGFVVGFLRR